jgi:hypothetical protein
LLRMLFVDVDAAFVDYEVIGRGRVVVNGWYEILASRRAFVEMYRVRQKKKRRGWKMEL